MSPILPAVMWIDPGDMTGIAVIYDHGRHFWCDELPFMDAGDCIEGVCQRWQRQVAVGWERYTIRQDLPQTHAYDAIGMIAVTRRYAHKHRCVVLPSAEGHTPTPDERRRLSAIGWWRPGKNDAQSAACHMLLYLTRTSQLPPAERQKLSAAVRTM